MVERTFGRAAPRPRPLGSASGRDTGSIGDAIALQPLVVGTRKPILARGGRALGVEQLLHARAPGFGVLFAAEAAHVGERAHDLGEAHQLRVVGFGFGRGRRNRRWRLGREKRLRALARVLSQCRAPRRDCHARCQQGGGGTPHDAASTIAQAASSSGARWSVVARPAISSREAQITASASGPAVPSPAIQRPTKEAIT